VSAGRLASLPWLLACSSSGAHQDRSVAAGWLAGLLLDPFGIKTTVVA